MHGDESDKHQPCMNRVIIYKKNIRDRIREQEIRTYTRSGSLKDLNHE